MRISYLIALFVTIPSLSYAAKVDLDTIEKKASYSIGVDFVTRMKAQGTALDFETLVLGLKDASAGKKLLLTEKERSQAIQDFQKKVQATRKAKQAKLAEANLKAGNDFLKANAKKEGVVTTKSGLQYKIIKKGTGAKPKLDDTVVTHYEGRLINGQVFDSSYKRNKPATFPVKGVIKGWTEALQLMKTGAKWQLYIPSDIAYGASQRGKQIQPNSTLIFDIELLEVKSSK